MQELQQHTQMGEPLITIDFARRHPLSPSQVDTYRDCPRKWGFRYLDRLKSPPNKYAQRGLDVHDVLEKWLIDAVPIPNTDAGKIAMAGIKFLPSPKTGQAEKEFTFETASLVHRGKKDWRKREPGYVRIIDHKTTTDFRWIKVANDLRKDVQANTYTVHEIYETLVGRSAEEPRVDQDWIYYRANPKRPKALRVAIRVIPDRALDPPRPDDVRPEHYGVLRYSELAENFAGIERDGLIMLGHHKAGLKGMDLEYNIEVCEKYGGCPYRSNPCRLKLSEMMRGHMAKESLAERMRAAVRKDKAGAAPPPPQGNGAAATAPAAARAQASPEAKAEVSSMKSGEQAQSSPPDVNPPDLSKEQKRPEASAPKAAAATSQPSAPLSAYGRAHMAGQIACSVIEARIMPPSMEISADGYADAVAAFSVKIAKAIEEHASK